MALRASPDRSIVIGLTNCMALLATGSGCGMAFRKNEGVRWPLRATRLELLAEGDLFRTEAFFSVDRGPARRGMSATEEFLIDAFVAGAAVAGGQMSGDRKSVVIYFLLIRTGLVAVKAIYALLRVGAHLVFMHHRVLEARVALRAFTRRTNEVCRWLGRFYSRTLPIDKKCGHDQSERDDNGEKHRTKRHRAELL
jgi:hypothetical protein